MSKTLFLSLFIFNLFSFDSSYWAIEKEFVLQKDELLKLDIKKDKDREELNYLWTLFIDKELVNKLWYKRSYFTFSLEKRYKRELFKLKLFNKNSGFREDDYMLIKFVDFDVKKNSATIKIYIHNESENIEIKRR